MKNVEEKDDDADAAINVMIAAVIGTAIVPAHVNWALTAAAMGAGVVAIGLAYEVKIDKDEAWKLIKQFFFGAGFWFIAMNISSKIFAMILSSTGIGHIGAIAIDGAISGASAYAIGACAKHYFRQDYLGKGKPTSEELGELFRDAFRKKREENK